MRKKLHTQVCSRMRCHSSSKDVIYELRRPAPHE